MKETIVDIERSLELHPGDVHALIKLGGMHIDSGNTGKALSCFQKAVESAPNFAVAWDALFKAYQYINQLADMAAYCEKAIQKYPSNPLAWTYQGYAFELSNQPDKALSAYKHAIDLTTGRYDLWERMGHINAKYGRHEGALTCLRTAIDEGSRDVQTHLIYAKILRVTGGTTECEEYCRRALDISPGYNPALIELGMALIDLGDNKNAINYLNQALEAEPENSEIASGLAQAYDRMGESNEAYEAIRPLLKSGSKDPGIACTYAKLSPNIGKTRDAIALLEEILGNNNLILHQRIDLHFMAGVLFDELGEFSNAMRHFDLANSIKPTNFDPDAFTRFIDNIINNFSSDSFKNLPTSGNQDERPVFIVGMMRSGTSLVEQIIASHDSIYGCGELMGMTLAAREIGLYQHLNDSGVSLDTLLTQEKLAFHSQEYLDKLPPEALATKRFTDKMPNNFLNLGLIALLFPNSRIIHTRRNPLDTCLSIYCINFAGRHDYAYNLENLGIYYRQYLKLMDHWRSVLPVSMLEIEYEDLVSDPETVCHSLVEFCGVDWSDEVLKFHKSARPINTASYNQVRKPVYTSSVGKWEKYGSYLEPLKSALGI